MKTIALLIALLPIAPFASSQQFEVATRASSPRTTWEYAMNLPPAAPATAAIEPLYAKANRPAPPVHEPLPASQLVAVELGVTDTVDVTCTDASNLTPLILGKAVAKIAEMYVCYIRNNSAESVMMSEGAVLNRMPQLLPYDGATFQLALSRVVTTSTAERIVRLLADPASIFLFLGASKIITMPAQVITGMAIYNAESPYIAQRIKGSEIPMQTNYQALAINGSITVAPGDTAITHIFGRPQPAGPGLAQFRLSVANAPRVRSVR